MIAATLVWLMGCVGQAAPAQEPRIKPEDLEPIARIGIQRVLSRVLEVPVTVGEVKLLPDQGRMELHGVSVANPEGFESPTAIAAENVIVEGNTESFFTKSPEIRLIQATGARVNAETRLPQGNNLQKLLGNAREMRQGVLQEYMQKRWRIQKAVLEDAEVTVGTQLLSQQPQQRKLESLEMDFMGPNGEGMPAQEAMTKFLTRLIQEMDLVSTVVPPGAQGIVNEVLPGLGGLGSEPKQGERRRPGARLRELLD